jgi:Protein of unknown function (DUF4240)
VVSQLGDALTVEEFWALVEGTGVESSGDCDRHAELLQDELRRLPAGDIEAFARIWARVFVDAYRWELWGAAYLINGGCSADGFDDFRAWVISQGREVYEAMLQDPEWLASYPPVIDRNTYQDPLFCERILYAADFAYQSVAGRTLPEDISPPSPDLNEEWDFDDEETMKRRYPRLWQRVQEIENSHWMKGRPEGGG